VRATTLVARQLALPGIEVVGVSVRPEDRLIVAEVRLRRTELACPCCPFTTASRYDTRPVASRWRHLDGGVWRVEVRAVLRRLHCPTHKVVVERVPFARAGARFTRDFEDHTAFAVTKTDKTTVARLLRIDWDTVGRICQRVVAEQLRQRDFLTGLSVIGVDEIAWKTGYQYLTLVTDHESGKIVWGGPGKGTATLDTFFARLGPNRTANLQAVSLDMGQAFTRSVYLNAPHATMCVDPFHAVRPVIDAMEKQRRLTYAHLRATNDPLLTHTYRGMRWALLKNPDTLNPQQAAALRAVKRRGGDLLRAYKLKESFRAIFAGDLTPEQARRLIDRWLSQASRSRLQPLTTAARTIRTYREGILDAIRLRINNARAEALNNHVRLIIRRARGFHSLAATLAMIMLCCGPITVQLPHERRPNYSP
jgi:transposase